MVYPIKISIIRSFSGNLHIFSMTSMAPASMAPGLGAPQQPIPSAAGGVEGDRKPTAKFTLNDMLLFVHIYIYTQLSVFIVSKCLFFFTFKYMHQKWYVYIKYFVVYSCVYIYICIATCIWMDVLGIWF